MGRCTRFPKAVEIKCACSLRPKVTWWRGNGAARVQDVTWTRSARYGLPGSLFEEYPVATHLIPANGSPDRRWLRWRWPLCRQTLSPYAENSGRCVWKKKAKRCVIRITLNLIRVNSSKLLNMGKVERSDLGGSIYELFKRGDESEWTFYTK